ncbi:hypothetical protein OAQ34_09610 [Opitutales bacterium]|jgi:hypothetical protein|nr:hypothetical protein [Opitutales bacterium]MDC1309790.1 hypothetical protein [Opitutales bacterium]
MDPREVIKTHLLLCEDVYSILLEENTWLKTEKQAPTMDLLGRKQVILPQLEDSLANLKKLKPEYFSPFDDSKKLVGQSHAKLLQIFYIDRENEELLLKFSQSTERQTFNRFTTPPEEIDDIHKSIPGQEEEEGGSDGVEEEPPSPQTR